jgi:hypothetical protein
MKYRISRLQNDFWEWLSYLLPRKLVYYATIRLWAYATTGKYSTVEAPSATVIDCIKRWKDQSRIPNK